MSSIRVETQLSADDLLAALEQLDPLELARFVEGVLKNVSPGISE